MILTMAVLLLQFPVAASAANSRQQPSSQPAAQSVASAAAPSTSKSATAPPVAAAAPSDNSKPNLQPIQLPIDPVWPAASDSLYVPPPDFRPPNEMTFAQPKWWFVLGAAEHSSATFDAWSTRRALSAGRVEADPIMRPFAGSPAIYGAVQVIPVGLDYLARRLQRSSGWTRHFWWAPQSIATATSLFSGSYNVVHTNVAHSN
jgi:hypothetical protein